MTLAELLDQLEAGRIGHYEAMRWLGVDNVNALVEIVHLNGRKMPGHIPMQISEETRNLLRLVTKPLEPNM